MRISKDEWEVLFKSKRGFRLKTRNKLCWNDSRYLYIPTYKLKEEGFRVEDYEGEVYDLTVEGEESFATPYMILHNSRNVYQSGGGNDLGDRVPEWVELRSICNALGISCWREYEAYLKRGNVDPLLKKFLIKCLDMPRTDFGVEYRQMSLMYWAIHPDELTPEILYKIKNPPKMTPEQEVEWFVVSQYRQILGREPDDAGRRHYTQAILEGRIRREDLPKILMMSEEYRQKFNIDETVQWVIASYRQVLKRDPDEEGLRVYVDHIVKGRINREDLPRILMESDEYRQLQLRPTPLPHVHLTHNKKSKNNGVRRV